MIPNDEKETSCTYDYETKQWNVYSSVPAHINKLTKLKKPYWTEKEEGRVIAAKWKLEEKNISFRALVELSDERRAEMSERAKLLLAPRSM